MPLKGQASPCMIMQIRTEKDPRGRWWWCQPLLLSRYHWEERPTPLSRQSEHRGSDRGLPDLTWKYGIRHLSANNQPRFLANAVQTKEKLCVGRDSQQPLVSAMEVNFTFLGYQAQFLHEPHKRTCWHSLGRWHEKRSHLSPRSYFHGRHKIEMSYTSSSPAPDENTHPVCAQSTDKL